MGGGLNQPHIFVCPFKIQVLNLKGPMVFKECIRGSFKFSAYSMNIFEKLIIALMKLLLKQKLLMSIQSGYISDLLSVDN